MYQFVVSHLRSKYNCRLRRRMYAEFPVGPARHFRSPYSVRQSKLEHVPVSKFDFRAASKGLSILTVEMMI
jgi:hypothetical protein